MLATWLEEAFGGLYHQAIDLASLLFLDIDDFCDELKQEHRDEVIQAVRTLFATGQGLGDRWPCLNKEAIRTGLALVDAEIRSRRIPGWIRFFPGLAN